VSPSDVLENSNRMRRDEPLCVVAVIAEFLQSPADLAFRNEGVTLKLNKSNADFFKHEASNAIPANDPTPA
jgi:predicted alternative tryptophan synthase beta-subunit